MPAQSWPYPAPNPISQTALRRDSSQPRKRLRPADVLVRAATAELLRQSDGPNTHEDVAGVLERHYGSCPATLAYLARAAVSPATTTTPTWAAELIDTAMIDFMSVDMARQSGFAQLAGLALTVPLEPGVGSVKIPGRASPVSLMGSWIAEGGTKPVFAAALNAVTLVANKLSAVAVFSEEMTEMSSIEMIVRETLAHDMSSLLDSALFDTAAVSATRPAGLFNLASSVTASALTPPGEAMLADLKNLTAAVAGTANPDAEVAIVVNPAQATRIRITAPQYSTNLIVSGFMAVNTVGAIDVGAIAMTVGQPEFRVSSDAVVHMETAALPVSVAGVPSSVAVPLSSLFQQDLAALRIVVRAGWIKRRATATALATAVIW